MTSSLLYCRRLFASAVAYIHEEWPASRTGRVTAAYVSGTVVGGVTARIGAPETIALSGLIVGIGGPLLLTATGALAAVRAPTARAAAADRV